MLSRKLHLPWVAAVVAALLAVTAVLTARSALAYDFTKPTKLAQTMGGSAARGQWLHVSGAPAYMVEVKTGSTTLKVMTGNNTAVLKPLKRATTYSIRVAVAADASASAKRMSDWSSTMKLKTSNNALNPPTDLTVTKSATSSATLKWTPPEGVLSTDRYSVTYALDSGLKKSAKTAVTEDSTPSITLTSMTSDTNFYVRVKVVGTDGKTVRSDTSDFGLIKTRAQTGVISGKVTDGTAAHIVVAAYDASGELVSQVDPSSSGAFKLTVRPGTYTVQASYIGTGGTISLWSKSDSAGVPTRAQATTYTVAEGKTVTLPDAIELSGGGKATGIVTDSSSGAAVRDVDVTALLSGEVIARAATDGNGAYTLDGLPSGSYVAVQVPRRGRHRGRFQGREPEPEDHRRQDHRGRYSGSAARRVGEGEQALRVRHQEGRQDRQAGWQHVRGQPLPAGAGDQLAVPVVPQRQGDQRRHRVQLQADQVRQGQEDLAAGHVLPHRFRDHDGLDEVLHRQVDWGS